MDISNLLLGPPAGWMAAYRLETRKTVGEPKPVGVVVDLERLRFVFEGDPTDVRSRVDMNVGRDVGRVIQCAAAYEPHLRPSVFAEDRP